jgi:hypothetical protein
MRTGTANKPVQFVRAARPTHKCTLFAAYGGRLESERITVKSASPLILGALLRGKLREALIEGTAGTHR